MVALLRAFVDAQQVASCAQSCTAAIFLREFVAGLKNNAPEGQEQEEDTTRYAHIDIGALPSLAIASLRS